MNRYLVVGLIGLLSLVSCSSKPTVSVVSVSCQVENIWQDNGYKAFTKIETTYWSDGSKTTKKLGWPSPKNYYTGAPCA